MSDKPKIKNDPENYITVGMAQAKRRSEWLAKLSDLLTPPKECCAIPALPMPDRRKGAIWFCAHARKNIGKGRKRPACLCATALQDCRTALRDAGGGE